MSTIPQLHLNAKTRQPLLRDHPTPSHDGAPLSPTQSHSHPPEATSFPSSSSSSSSNDGDEEPNNASVFFIGTATTILSWRGIRILTDPNFLHAGDHVHLGPGVSATRVTNPAVELDALPPIDCVLLSHYHEDHFDRVVEARLNRKVPIVTTPHAKRCLTEQQHKKEEGGGVFENVWAVDRFESVLLRVGGGDGEGDGDGDGDGREAVIKVTGMPGKHVPPGPAGALAAVNDFLGAVPPTNGWMLELGFLGSPQNAENDVPTGYRIYISGDTLFVDDLKQIPEWLNEQRVDLMLLHLGGTTIPGPHLPLMMVTMDAAQGLKLMRLVDPDVTVPIHYDDYDVFLSPLSDFTNEINAEGWRDRVVYLDRGEEYRFRVREGGEK